MPCFYTPALKEKDNGLLIDGEEFHHIVKVFRHKQGDRITINNGKGLLAEAEIVDIRKRELNVRIIDRQIQKAGLPELEVCFSLLKNKNDFLLVEKLTELGVRRLQPVIFSRTVRTGSANTLEKLDKIAVSAVKQCNNPRKPDILQPVQLRQLIADKAAGQELLLAATERDSSFYIEKFIPANLPPKITIIIGPEGGFTGDEIDLMRNAGISLFTLGDLILRAETAAICAVSQLQLLIAQRNQI